MLQRTACVAVARLTPAAFRCATHSAPLGVLGRAASTSSMPELITEVKDGIGFIRLNRPRVLNSLNTSLVKSLQSVYGEWTKPGSSTRCIVLSGEGGKAFCAGGDVKWVVQEAVAGRPFVAQDFFEQEYQLDLTIGSLSLPHISLWDGIVMGGGAGISCHGHFRVATERTMFAMPEVGIGLFPDVGMMHRLVQLPGAVGTYLALTGARVTGKDCKDAGLATHYIPSASLPDLLQQLQQLGPAASDLSVVDRTLRDAELAGASSSSSSGGATGQLLMRMPVINKCFGDAAGGVAGVLQALEADTWDKEWSSSTLAALKRGSPLSAAVTWSYLQRTRQQHLTLAQVLKLDALLAGHFSSGRGDFYEGVRARLIDKDDAPKWKHANVQQVIAAEVEPFFQPWAEEQAAALHPGAGRGVASSRL